MQQQQHATPMGTISGHSPIFPLVCGEDGYSFSFGSFHCHFHHHPCHYHPISALHPPPHPLHLVDFHSVLIFLLQYGQCGSHCHRGV